MHKGPLVRKNPRKRNKDGTWRSKRSDAGKKREKIMPYIEKSQNRLIHIEGLGKRFDGRDINVYDAQTGELLQNIYRITIRIDGSGGNEADIVYHKLEDPNRLAHMEGEDAEETVTVKDVEIAGTILAEAKEYQSIKIDRLDGSCPVQATGTIEDHSVFYFRGRHEQWQFVAGPKELSTDDLVGVKLKMTQDDRVFVIEGDDENRDYQDYDHVRNVLQDYAEQYIEWMKERNEGRG
jgi:hypothetical protein